MLKHDRIRAFVGTLDSPADVDPRYAGYFACFNRGDYYEAHDVLEHLWLQDRTPDRSFYQGLIQLAGAFVHLRKQAERPWHPKDGARLNPAARLLRLADARLAAYPPVHHGADVAAIRGLIGTLLTQLSGGGSNPWSPACRPQLALGARR